MNDSLKNQISRGESEELDFKSSFNPHSSAEWLEIMKDIIAIANTQGGNIIIGLNDNGTRSNLQVHDLTAIDSADITTKVYKYTDYQFHEFAIFKDTYQDGDVFIFEIKRVDVPIVFNKPGTYLIDNTRQKTAFSSGTVYFRHGTKSEPGTTDDLRRFLDRQLECVKKSWLDGIAKVVEAPAGAQIVVVSAEIANANSPDATRIRITDDPSAPAFRAVKVDDTHPYRQMDIAKIVNTKLAGKIKIRPYEVLSIRRKHNIDSDIRYCYKMKFASPRYSSDFANWIVEQFEKNQYFFKNL